jgi:hypothetical protein
LAVPKIFVSSTCYDLNVIRTELRSFIQIYGFEPVMSEFSDILYDYRVHIQTSCLQEISYCDMVILIIGSRFGGKSFPKTLEYIDIESLKNKILSSEVLKEKENLSITQLEYLKCIEIGLPIFTFASAGVMNDLNTWERNKEKGFVNDIIYPNIGTQETAKYIFEFINCIRSQHEGNSITLFSTLDDIKTHLRKQWAALFQRFLKEQRDKIQGEKQINYLSEQIADLKTAIITSISDTDVEYFARGIIKYRQVISLIYIMAKRLEDVVEFLAEDVDWNYLLDSLGVIYVVEMFDMLERPSNGIVFIFNDNSYFKTKYHEENFNEFQRKWNQFREMKETSKKAIINAIIDTADDIIRPYIGEHHSKNIFETELSKDSNANYSFIWRNEEELDKISFIS